MESLESVCEIGRKDSGSRFLLIGIQVNALVFTYLSNKSGQMAINVRNKNRSEIEMKFACGTLLVVFYLHADNKKSYRLGSGRIR